MAVQFLKNYLVRQGPKSSLVRASLKLHARAHGFRLEFFDGRISLQNGSRELLLKDAEYVQVPIMMQCYNSFFDAVCSVSREGREVLDFSQPGPHRYKRSGVAFNFPSIAEDVAIDAFTSWYTPGLGDIVWDAGAHAGATSYFLAQMVGARGKVYAFEPDECNFEFLMGNLEMHKLTNVIPIKKALAFRKGEATFNMDGTVAAGIREYLVYYGSGKSINIPTLGLADACEELGEVPNYVKMDIEGAEVAVIEGAAEFLREHPIHFAIESNHRWGDKYTHEALDQIFPQLGYEVLSSDKFGQMLTWARPRLA